MSAEICKTLEEIGWGGKWRRQGELKGKLETARALFLVMAMPIFQTGS